MAKPELPRYFTERPGKDGPRYFWQPSSSLAAHGWKLERLPAELGAAVTRAEQLNADLDLWRAGQAPAPKSAAVAQAPGPFVQPRSVADLIRRYKEDRRYTTKAKNTRDSYDRNLALIEAWAGDKPAAAIGPARVEKLYTSLYASAPSKANHLVAMVRILFGFAIKLEWIRSNPAEKPGLIGQAGGGKLWPDEAVWLFAEVADRYNFGTAEKPLHFSSIGTAVVIDDWLGQREADILSLKRTSYRGGRFWIRQAKTGAMVAVPEAPDVALRVEQERAQQKARGIESATHLLLDEETGQPWEVKKFQVKFAELRAAAAEIWPAFFDPETDELAVKMGELEFRHLRHTALTKLLGAGCSIAEGASITGHTLQSATRIADTYFVRTAGIAAGAAAKRLAHREKD
jgi:integrase